MSFIFNKLHNKFHLCTYTGDYCNVIWLFLIVFFSEFCYAKDRYGIKI